MGKRRYDFSKGKVVMGWRLGEINLHGFSFDHNLQELGDMKEFPTTEFGNFWRAHSVNKLIRYSAIYCEGF